MKSLHLTALLTVLLLALTACSLGGSSDNTADDSAAAQRFIPNLPGYTETETTDVQDALAGILGGSGALTGNFVQSAAVLTLDRLVDCYRDRGAFDARLYSQNIELTNIQTPIVGVLAVINQDRVAEEFINCVLPEFMRPDDFGAQAAGPQPCFGYGSFSFEGDTISFIYGATDRPLCDSFNSFFAPFNPTGDTR